MVSEEIIKQQERFKQQGLPYIDYKTNKLYNTHHFKEVSKYAEEHGLYTKIERDTPNWVKFWEKELDKCENGITIGGITINGYFYFFLNYFILPVHEVDDDGVVATNYKTANFWQLHYNLFWALEISRKGITQEKFDKLGLFLKPHTEDLSGNKHLCLIKPRQVGMSNVFGSILARDFSIRRIGSKNYKKLIMYAASEIYLSDVLDKCWTTLDYLSRMDVGFKHERMVHNEPFHKKASYKTDGASPIEIQTGGEVIGIILNDPNKSRGKSAYTLFFEEAGSIKRLEEAISIARPSVEVGGRMTGQIIMGGTGGHVDATNSKGSSIQGLRNSILKPSTNNFMRFDNSHYQRGMDETGLFFPVQFAHHGIAIDKDGNIDFEKATQHELNERNKLKDDPDALMRRKAEYPMTISEALSQETSSFFNAEKLVNQQLKLERYSKEKTGRFEWDSVGDKIFVKFIPDPKGKVVIVEEPIENPPSYLYIAGIDSIDYGTSNSTTTNGSAFAMIMKKRTLGMSHGNKYVAYYKDRPYNEKDAYEIALQMLWYYNATANVERTRKEIVTFFERPIIKVNSTPINLPKQTGKFCLEPTKAQEGNLNYKMNNRKGKQLVGTNARPDTIKYMESLQRDYIQEHSDTIEILPLITELLMYDGTNRSKCDLVVASQLVELYDMELLLTNRFPKKSEIKEQSVKKDIKWVKTNNGYVKKIVQENPRKELEDSFKNMLRNEKYH